MRRILVISSTVLCLWVGIATASEEDAEELEPLVVTASRTAVPLARAGSSITLISRQEIEQRHAQFVIDLLREVPGVAVSRSGGVGQFAQARLRGAEANQTLILIDGIEANDPGLGSEFDFADLLAFDVESIEVIRGPQSSLWGSDALAGVISITTRRAEHPLRLTGHAGGGSFGTFRGGGSLERKSQKYHLAVFGTHYQSDGINVAEHGDEDDGYTNGTVSLRGGVDPLPGLSIEAVGRHTDGRSEFDPTPFPLFRPADGDREREVEQNYGRVQATLDLFEGGWQHRLGAAITDTDNDNFEDGVEETSTNGEKFKIDYQTSVFFETAVLADAVHTLTFAFEHEREEFVQRGTPSFFGDPNQDQDTTNIGYVGEYRLEVWDQVFLSGAVRQEDNDLFEDATTYRATVAYVHPSWSTKLHGSYGTGVKNPSFTERFGFTPDTFFGNPNLAPEKSEGWEIGIEQPFFRGRLTAGATYFDEQLEEEINGFFFDPALGPFGGFTPVNTDGESERQGVEMILTAIPLEGFSLKGAYTYTDSTQPDEVTGQDVREIRRPEHVASLAGNYRFLADRANINLTVEYTGEQIDNDFSTVPATRVTLDHYTLVNLAMSYALHEKVRVFGRVENLLDEDYQDVFGFETPGIGGLLGLEVGLDLM